MAPVATEPAASEPPTFEQAFALAKEKHSAPAEQAPPAEVSTPAEDDDEPAPPAKEPAAPAATTAATTKIEDAKPSDTLISDTEFTALQTKYAGQPEKLQKELNKVFTQKTQALAEERKGFEKAKPYLGIIDAFAEDAEATITALAAQYGMTVTPKGTTGPATATTERTAAATEAVVEDVVKEFRTALGPDLEYLAESLGPAIKGMVERLTKTTIDQATQPLKDQQQVLLDKTAAEAADVVIKELTTKHPDWKEHEPAMLALAQKVQPNGMGELEYLEHLYASVTRDRWDAKRETEIADAVQAALDKIQKGATTPERRATPERSVSKVPPANATFEDAFEAAKRGERWE